MSLAVFLEWRGESALVVGGGPVALRRARTLVEAGLCVTVVAPDLLPGFDTLPVQVERRAYRPADVEGQRVVVAATDRDDVNDAVVGDARNAGILANHAGDAARGTLRFPAVAERGGVRVAVNTGRELPMLAQALRERVVGLLPSAEDVDGWAMRREQAVGLSGPARERALAGLRAEIRLAVGLPAEGAA